MSGVTEQQRQNKAQMKTASLGLLEVPVVRVNAGGDAPPDPLSVGDVTGHSPFLCFLQEQFLANEREHIFCGLTVKVFTRNHIKQMAGLVPLVCT